MTAVTAISFCVSLITASDLIYPKQDKSQIRRLELEQTTTVLSFVSFNLLFVLIKNTKVGRQGRHHGTDVTYLIRKSLD